MGPERADHAPGEIAPVKEPVPDTDPVLARCECWDRLT